MKALELLQFMETLAPPELAEEWDNCGLQVGSEADEIARILLALDCTEAVLRQANPNTLVITHHPLLFHPLSCLERDSLPARALLQGVTVASYHTSLDRAPGGVNDCLAEALSLSQISELPESENLGRIGRIDPLSPEQFAQQTAETLGCAAPRIVCGSRPVQTVALASGAGGEFVTAAIQAGADAFVTGELKHHEALEAVRAGITVVEAGHFETERVILPSLQKRISKAFPSLPVEIAEETSPYKS